MLRIAYCSNVHAGSSLEETRANLARYTSAVKRHFSPDETMGVGLWLSARTATEILADGAAIRGFSEFLQQAGIVPFTFNGFPFGNFHQDVVKHDVYQPTWFERSRLDYTWNLVRLIHAFAPEGWETSISTLPIAWGSPTPIQEIPVAAEMLRELATRLAKFEQETGRVVYVCVEPEPGCVIQYSEDVVRFFETQLLTHGNEDCIRRHIRVCHDVCHGVVMGESQSDILAKYQRAGILIGKVQISSAVVVDFDAIDASDRANAIAQLAEFAEDRYLHQTTIQAGDGTICFYEDLPLALRTVEEPTAATGTWRIHFHVPVYLSRFGWLNASQQDIVDCVATIRQFSDVQHFEVETYAWNVLPDELKQDDLAVGITDELQWFTKLAAKHLTTDAS